MVNTIQAGKIKAAFTKVINAWGSDVTLTPEASATDDAWGEPVVVDGTPVITLGVLDTNIIAKMNLGSQGRLKSGELMLILKGDETIDETFKITISGTDYNILSLDRTTAANTVIVYQIVLGSK